MSVRLTQESELILIICHVDVNSHPGGLLMSRRRTLSGKKMALLPRVVPGHCAR